MERPGEQSPARLEAARGVAQQSPVALQAPCAHIRRSGRAQAGMRGFRELTWNSIFCEARQASTCETSARGEEIAHEIPMPSLPRHACARILEGLMLKVRGGEPGGAAKCQQAISVGRNKVRHRATLPCVSVQPEPSLHREDHPLSSERELSVRALVVRTIAVDRDAGHARGVSDGSVAGDVSFERRRSDLGRATEIDRARFATQ